MVEPITLSEIVSRLAQKGYTENFRAQENNIRAIARGIDLKPEDLLVDKIYRFEGETDLDDEEMVFALSCPNTQIKGTYVVAYGPMMDPVDAEMVVRLKKNYEKKGRITRP